MVQKNQPILAQWFITQVKKSDSLGWTALMHAAKLGLCHFYELLKEEQDILNNNGQTVLMVCVLNRQLEFAKLVLH